MLDRRFRAVELSFHQLSKQFRRGEISREQYAEALRKLRLLDNEGRCWMIGAQTGRWYYYDGQKWIQSEPPEDGSGSILCPNCYHQNEPEARVCQACRTVLVKTSTKIVCLNCGNLIDSTLKICPYCEAEVFGQAQVTQAGDKAIEAVSPTRPDEGSWAYLRSVDQVTFLLFSGGLGIFLGVLFGLLLGSTEFFPGFVASLPAFLRDMQGKLIGGLVFSLLGGVLGFILAAASGFVLALLINAAIYFFGEPGFRLEKKKKRIFLK
ncbi:MAG: zinc ribbon domain-containing protein [Candidatus Saccharicenans sp.]|uniref:zinc ribbon domain-containing protein n=1 Tax=Candidatus Saccharicenans sp. TaxID=2819258 RepID=UPI004049A14E